MKTRSGTLLLCPLMLLVGCSGGGGSVQSCALVKEAELPVTFENNTPVVEVSLNGEKTHLVVDTGSNGTVLTEAAFQRLNLATDPNGTHVVSGVGGMTGHRGALVSHLELGAVARRNISVAVVNMPQPGGGKADGFLGNDVLERFDVDLDLPHSRIALYQPRNCAAGLPDWTTAAELLPRPGAGNSLPPNMISVTLDGMAENALVDTGASYTTIARTRALAAGVTEQMLQADHQGSVQGIARARADVAAHRFTSLQIGTESFSRPTLIVAPLPGSVDNTSYHMLLGEDYLRKHRVWISYDGYSVHVARPKP